MSEEKIQTGAGNAPEQAAKSEKANRANSIKYVQQKPNGL